LGGEECPILSSCVKEIDYDFLETLTTLRMLAAKPPQMMTIPITIIVIALPDI